MTWFGAQIGVAWNSVKIYNSLGSARKAGGCGEIFYGESPWIRPDKPFHLIKSLTLLWRSSRGQEDSPTSGQPIWSPLRTRRFSALIRLLEMSFPNFSASKQSSSSPPNSVPDVAVRLSTSPLNLGSCRADVVTSGSERMSFIARLAASIFFPQFKILGCDVDQAQTPAVLKKISVAAARDRSYQVASRNLDDLADLTVPPKQCQRVAIRIGNERLDEQNARIEAYQQATLPQQRHGQPQDAPQNDWAGRVAVVQADGGRAQIRDSLWGQDKSGDKKHRWWRETQTGCLQTYLSKPVLEDPHPQVPDSLLDALWVVPKFKEIHRQHASSERCEEVTAEDVEPDSRSNVDEHSESPEKVDAGGTQEPHQRWSGGEPLVKTVIATRQGYDHLGLAMAAEAYHRGFNKAVSKAFMGDGLKVNWTLWARHFSHYTPIADLMHALSYVYAAAVACGATIEDGWALYVRWLGLVWSGKVQQVIQAMQELANQSEEPRHDLDRAITYLSNNASRMKYAEYRCAGLPITTSLVESTQKQINYRIKGTEKFWRDEHLEPLLQLVTDDLSDTHDRAAFWERRQQRYDGFRKRRHKTKIKNS